MQYSLHHQRRVALVMEDRVVLKRCPRVDLTFYIDDLTSYSMNAAYQTRQHRGYWVKDSFYAIQGKDFLKGMFLGIHKSRNYKNVENPIDMDFEPKASIVMLTGMNDFEAILFPSKQVERFFAAIAATVPTINLFEESKMNALLRFENPEYESVHEYYIDRNLHDTNLRIVIEEAQDKGHYYDVTNLPDPDKRQHDIQWIRDSHIYVERVSPKLHDIVQQLLVVGKDMRYNMPVIGMRKLIDGRLYGTIMPLVSPDAVATFATNLAFIVYHKPPEAPFKSVVAFERKMMEQQLYYATHLQYIAVDLLNIPIEKAIGMFQPQVG